MGSKKHKNIMLLICVLLTILFVIKPVIATETEKTPVVFLYFYKDGCSACTKKKPVIDSIEENYSKYVTFLRLDYSKNRDLYDTYDLEHLPSIVIINMTNNMYSVLNYYQSTYDNLSEALDMHIAGDYNIQDTAEDVKQNDLTMIIMVFAILFVVLIVSIVFSKKKEK